MARASRRPHPSFSLTTMLSQPPACPILSNAPTISRMPQTPHSPRLPPSRVGLPSATGARAKTIPPNPHHHAESEECGVDAAAKRKQIPLAAGYVWQARHAFFENQDNTRARLQATRSTQCNACRYRLPFRPARVAAASGTRTYGCSATRCRTTTIGNQAA